MYAQVLAQRFMQTPSTLVQQVQAAFAPGGWLERGQPQFRPRAGQLAMAEAVAQAIDEAQLLVVEAGTGVGKTFAYLVPALLSGYKVVISTATKALQDQLFERDLPRLLEQLGLPLRAARLKGRSSYVCQHRLAHIHQGQAAHDPQVLRALAQVQQWLPSTTSGDLSELPGLPEDLLPLVTSTRSNCVGHACAFWQSCHINHARAQALDAEVCVVNHHLLFADQQLQEEGVPPLLPQAGVVVVDEAHQLNDTGVQFAGITLSTRQLLGFARDAMKVTTQHARGLHPWLEALVGMEQAVLQWSAEAAALPVGTRHPWQGAAPDGVDAAAWQCQLQAVGRSLHWLWQALGSVAEAAPPLQQLQERTGQLLQTLALFARPTPVDAVRWLDRQIRHIALTQAPLTVAALLQAMVQPAPGAVPRQAWVFTSATLGDTPDLHWFTHTCGLQGARTLRVASPFNYPEQASLYVPPYAPPVYAQAEHSAFVAALASVGAQQLGGRTLVLTTTLKALRAIGTQLQRQLGMLEPIDVLVQGQGSRHALLERFRAGTLRGRGCMLVASATFWEGVDITGDALQLLIIDKLPFAPPDDPLVQARSRQQEGLGLNAFHDYLLPEAAMALKQGVGRLIRSETDRGMVVIADARLLEKGYGPRLLAALPPMRLLISPAAWQAELERLKHMKK